MPRSAAPAAIAAIYTRLSMDRDGASSATQRQEADCRQLCAERGWIVERVFTDNDVSAFDRKVKRPAFEALLAALAAGEFSTVVVWKSDRLARRGRDLQRFLNACEPSGATLTSCTEPEFTGSTGLLMLRILSGFAEHESSVKAERVARANKESAERGDPHRGGRRVFGYNRSFTPHKTEAPLVAEAVSRALFGDSGHAIVADWNKRGITTVSGGRWTASNFTRMLRAPVLAGLRSYHGELIEGTWKPLVKRDQWDMLQVVLAARAKPQKRVTRHLLTGLAFCECGGPMFGTTRRTWTEYRCNRERGGCGRVTMRGDALEGEVAAQLFAEAPAMAKRMRSTDRKARSTLAAQLAALDADTAALEDLHTARFVERTITAQAFTRAKHALDERIGQQRTAIAAAHTIAPLTDLPVRWQHASLTWRREVLDSAVRRIVVRAGRSDRVRVEWSA